MDMNAPADPTRSAPPRAAFLALLGALVLLSIDQALGAARRDALGSVAVSGVLAVVVAREAFRVARELGSRRVVLIGLVGAVAGYGLAQLVVRLVTRAVHPDAASPI